jgi:Reverse transcriptase (RNA-dependent DNA polymerase)/Endonuclease-reverse transcriptase
MDPDLILVTETWCNDQITDAYLSLPGYELVNELRKDRYDTDRGRGGGLIVYARTGLSICVLSTDENIDASFQYCKFKVYDVTMYLIYRSPSSGGESFSGMSDLLRVAEKNCVLVGDFNMPDIDWDNGTARGRACELLEAAQDRLLEQLVTFPTHVRGNTLDLILTDIPERVINITEEGRLGSSDHVIIAMSLVIKSSPSVQQNKGMPDWNRADWAGIKQELRRDDWDELLRGQSAEQAWCTLRDRIHALVDRYVPERRRRNHNRPPWLTRDILRAIRKKKRLWRQAKEGQNVTEYKAAEKAVKNQIRNAKRKFERDIAKGCGSEQANKKRFFSYIKKKTKSRPGIGPLKDGGGRTVQEDGEMAELLNRFFSGIFTREDVTNIPDPEPTNCRQELSGVNITVRAVKDKIKRLRVDGAAGPDRIGPLLLKRLVEEIAWPLTRVMRASLREGSVPEDWRTANVAPIFKKGSKSDAGNYRPVSLTSVSSRLMESIIKDQIVSHLDRNRLIRSTQHGFMRGRSCATNLLAFLDKMTATLDSGEAADVIYLDFAKAFDTVPHERLKKKLRAHGISGQLLKWIAAWLSNRKQRVVLNGKESSWEEVLSGVPQGSVLGPLLFIIFINDLDLSVSELELLLKFADDTKVARVIKDDTDRQGLQLALDRLIDWSERWGMIFNVKKCIVMHIGRNNPQSDYVMKNTTLGTTKEEKDLGVAISDSLKPAAQCARAAKTALAVLGQITRAFRYRDKLTFVQLYKQYVRPHLEFSVQAWSPWQQADKDKLERVQQKAIGMVSGLRGRTYEERLKELGLTTLEERRHQADMAHMYKICTEKDGLRKADWFAPPTAAAARTRQHADPLNVRPLHGRLETRSNFFTVRAGEPWNAIPGRIKHARTVSRFKRDYANYRNEMI